MILKAFDMLREIGWGVVKLIYNLIDTIYEIILGINELDIIGSMAENSTFSTFYSSIIVIALTIFGLMITWQFVKKVIEPDEGPTIFQIVQEIFKCGILVLLSTMLFIQISNFSIHLSGYVGNMLAIEKESTLGSEILINYISYSENYKASKDFEQDNYQDMLRNGTFGKMEHYNDKFVLEKRLIRSDERDYKYDIEWIMAWLVGGFFLYSTCFSAIMLAKRQIEFLFLFLISPIIFATSLCNKQRRGALVEQLVSLTLQSAVIMLIINITVLLATQINSTHFFDNNFQNMATKSIMYLGSAIFLLTGAQSINRFIGSNVSANAGREQLMSLMGFSKISKGVGSTIGSGTIGAGMVIGAGALKAGNYVAQKSGIASKMGYSTNNALNKIGNGIMNFGNSFGGSVLPDGTSMTTGNSLKRNVQNIGNSITRQGFNISQSAEIRNQNHQGIGLGRRISSGTSNMMKTGFNMISPLNKVPLVKKIITNNSKNRKGNR